MIPTNCSPLILNVGVCLLMVYIVILSVDAIIEHLYTTPGSASGSVAVRLLSTVVELM